MEASFPQRVSSLVKGNSQDTASRKKLMVFALPTATLMFATIVSLEVCCIALLWRLRQLIVDKR